MNKLGENAMKYVTIYLITAILCIGCSAMVSERGDFNYRYLRQEVAVGNPKVHIYEVKIGNQDRRELRVYAHDNKDQIFFIVDSYNETGKNSYEYKKKEFQNNFYNFYRKESLTITSFDDAMDKAVLQYIEDNLLPEEGENPKE